jgi:hypothetical protein
MSQPVAALSQDLRRRLIYLWLRKQARIWAVLSLVLVAGFSYRIVAPYLGKPWTAALGFVSPMVSVSNAIFVIVLAVALSLSMSKLLRSGRAVQGLVVGAWDDGIDRLYTIYYEDGPRAYEVQFTAKSKSPAGGLQSGDTITLILGPPQELGRQRVAFDLRASICSRPA